MKGINKAILLGIVGQDPTVKKVSDTFTVATFSLATTRSFKKDGEWVDLTEWHNISCYNQLAGIAEKIIHKGAVAYIDGEIKTTSYEKDGVKMYRTEIIASTITVAKKKGDGDSHAAAVDDEGDQGSPF